LEVSDDEGCCEAKGNQITIDLLPTEANRLLGTLEEGDSVGVERLVSGLSASDGHVDGLGSVPEGERRELVSKQIEEEWKRKDEREEEEDEKHTCFACCCTP